MAKIKLKHNSMIAAPTIDSDTLDVVIEDAFVGVTFLSPDGEELIVAMRDGGFEVCYNDVWYEMKQGVLKFYGPPIKISSQKMVPNEVDLNHIVPSTDFENAVRDRAREVLNNNMNLKIMKGETE